MIKTFKAIFSRSFVMNLVFVLGVPSVLSLSFAGKCYDWLIVPYIMIYALIELVIDCKHFQRSMKIVTYFVTLAYNMAIMCIASLIIVWYQELYSPLTKYIASICFGNVVLALWVASAIEDHIDERIYR